MAVQTIYVLATTAVTPNWFGNTQLNGSAPTAANTAYGWVPGTAAVTTPYRRGRLGATTTGTDTAVASSYNAGTSGPTPGTGSGATTAGDSFIAGPFTGTFAATAWTMNWNLRASTAGAKGNVNVRVWKSANANGSSPTQLMANTAGATITLSTTVDQNSLISWSPGALTFNNEYLFFQVEWQETTAGTSGTDNVFFRAGTSSITTSNLATQWQGAATFAGAGALTANLIKPLPPGGSTITFSNNVLHYALDEIIFGPLAEWLSFQNQDATDFGLNAANGTLVGSPTFDTSVSPPAIILNGSTQYVSGTNNPVISTTNTNVSLSCWVYLSSTSQTGCFMKFGAGDGVGFGVGASDMDTAGNNLVGLVENSLWMPFATAIGTGWHHVAMTSDSGATWRAYIDGVVCSPTFTNGGFAPTSVWSIGNDNGIRFFNGKIQDVRFYSAWLSPQQIAAIYAYGPRAKSGTFSSSAADTSGFNNYGIITGNGTTTVPGRIGSGWSFDGNGYISFTSVSNFSLASQTSELTACCWIKSSSTDCAILSLRSSINNNTLLDFTTGANGINNNGTGQPSVIIRGDTGTYTTINATSAVNDNAWHHIAFARNSSQLVTLYIDGVSNTSATDSLTGGLTPNSAGSAIGYEIIAATIPFIGSLDDFQIYSRALTSTEVNTLYIKGITPVTSWQGAGLLPGAGSLVATTQLLASIKGVFAGAGALAVNEDQWYAARATFAGAGALAATIQQILVATAGWSGAGALAVDVTRFVGGTAWQGNALLAGAGTLTVNEDQWYAGYANFAGLGALTAVGLVLRPITVGLSGVGALTTASAQWLALNSSFAGAGALAAVGLVLRPLTASFTGVGALSANTAQLLASAASWTASGQLSAAITQLQSISPVAFVGSGALSVFLAQAGAVTQWPGSAILAGAGSLQVTSTQWLTARSAFAGTGTLTAPTLAQLLPASASFVSTGSVTAQVAQLLLWQATAAGTGNLAVDLVRFTPGAWQGNATFAGVGALAAISTQQWLAATTVFAGAGNLSSQTALQLSASSAMTGIGNLAVDVAFLSKGLLAAGLFAGAGGFSAVASINVSAAAAFGAVGTLTAYAQFVASGQAQLAGSGAFSAQAQAVMALANAFAGAGALQADVDQWQLITAALAGNSSLTAKAGVWQHFETVAFAGAGSLIADMFTRALQLISCPPIQGQRSQIGTLQGTLQPLSLIRGQRQLPAEIIAQTEFEKTQPN